MQSVPTESIYSQKYILNLARTSFNKSNCKDGNYSKGYCYDCKIKDTCSIINYHVQYLLLDALRRFGNLKRLNFIKNFILLL